MVPPALRECKQPARSALHRIQCSAAHRNQSAEVSALHRKQSAHRAARRPQ